MNLSVVILALNESENISILIPRLRAVLSTVMSEVEYEIIVVDGGSTDDTACIADELADRLIIQSSPGYGCALREGFEAARGNYVATLDADLSHEPSFLPTMWRERSHAEIVIASRYEAGGTVDMPLTRLMLSHVLNTIFRLTLSLPVRDMSSGFRLYSTGVLEKIDYSGTNFDVLPEIIVRSYVNGWRIREVPFHYAPRQHGSSKARLIRFGLSYLRTLARMWRLRNSIESADYDERAFDSKIPFQRYWQRRRYSIITNWVPEDAVTLDVGCGSSRILRDQEAVVGLDIKLNKLRYMRRYDKVLMNGSIFELPFPDGAFDCVICSEVIEHVAFDVKLFSEMNRVLREGGTLIIGTPDYGSLKWVMIENIYKRVIPGGYADEHITHYTLDTLQEHLVTHGFRVCKVSSILGAEVILRAEKEK